MAERAVRYPVSFVTIKLLPPSVPHDLVARPRLTRRLSRALDSGLILVSTAAGFGKTTLLSEWIQRSLTDATAPFSVSWLSLDEADNDPVRFWHYVLCALEDCFPNEMKKLCPLLSSPFSSSHEPFLAALINSLVVLTANESTCHQRDCVLVLDDYHVIENAAIHQSLEYVIDHLPQRIHLVIASRVDPPLPLASYRGHGRLATIDASDLKFNDEEAAEFLRRRMGSGFSVQDAVALQALADGWVVGLQLLALSIGEHASMYGLSKKPESDDRNVADFLTSEVLAKLQPEVMAFLLGSSILDPLCSSLCQAVTGCAGSQQMLEELEHANVFIFPLDSNRGWYRYHRLFADCLRDRLYRTQPDDVHSLHCRASEWYEAHQMPLKAIKHALVSGDCERTARLIQSSYREFVMKGQFALLSDVLDSIPEPVLSTFPLLALARAWALIAKRHNDVEQYLCAAENAIFSGNAEREVPLESRIRPEMLVIRATVAGMRGDVHESLRLVNQAVLQVPKEDSFVHSMALNAAGTAAARGADPTIAISILRESRATTKMAHNVLAELVLLYFMANQYVYQGQLRRAEAIYDDMSILTADLADKDLPHKGLARIGIGSLQYEWNELSAAEDSLRVGIGLLERGMSMEFLAEAYITLARVKKAQGDLPDGMRILEDTMLFARQRRAARVVAEVEAYLTRFQLEAGDERAAYRWAQQAQDLDANEEDTPLKEIQAITLARVFFAWGRGAEALRILGRLLVDTTSTSRFGMVIEILVLQSLILRSQNRDEAAFTSLEQALELAEPERYIRVFADEGRAMFALLDDYLEARQSEPTARSQAALVYASLLRSAAESTLPGVENRRRINTQQSTALALTKREMQVCRLVVSGYTNHEIAESLFITENTVHSHRMSAYRKLEVKSRRQLVQKIRS